MKLPVLPSLGAIASIQSQSAPFKAPSNTSSAATGSTATVTAPADVSDGAITLAAKPPACTASAVPYTTSIWVKGSQITVNDGGSWWNGKDNVNWTFSTNTSNVIFGWPFYPSSFGHGDPTNPEVLPRTAGNSFSLNMSSDSAAEEGMFFFNAFHANSTNSGPSVWNQSKPVSSGTGDAVTFQLNIEGSVPCDHPVGNASCANGEIATTTDSWDAYAVDYWFKDWYQKHSSSFTNTSGMLQQFRNEFNIGTGDICTIDNQCQVLDSCKELSTTNSTEAGAVYLTWIALQNLSDMFHNAQVALQLSELYTLTQIGDIALKFSTVNADVNTPAVSPLSIASGAMGSLSGITGAIGLSFPSTGLGIASSIAGTVNSASAKTTSAMPDSQYATNAANASAYLGNYLQSVRDAMETAYDSIFTHGTNITSLLSQGAFVNRTSLQLDCSHCNQQSQGWLEQYLGLKMINSIWTQQNAFITLLPYGTITQVDSDGNTGVKTKFDEGDCVNFNAGELPKVCFAEDGSGVDWPKGLNPGMAVLTFYNAHGSKNKLGDSSGPGILDLTTPPAGADYTGKDQSPALNTTTSSQYKFNVADAITSAVGGFAKGGFGYDFTEEAVKSAITDGRQLGSLFNATASTPGMFNMPVCILKDLNFFPTFWSQPGRKGSMNLCQCNGSPDLHGNRFEKAAVPELAYIASHSLEVNRNVSCT